MLIINFVRGIFVHAKIILELHSLISMKCGRLRASQAELPLYGSGSGLSKLERFLHLQPKRLVVTSLTTLTRRQLIFYADPFGCLELEGSEGGECSLSLSHLSEFFLSLLGFHLVKQGVSGATL